MKYYNILLTIILVGLAHFLSAQDLEWVKQIQGFGTQRAMAIDSDSLGNVYTVGTFDSTVDFDLGAGVFNLTAFNYDLFITKLDMNGDFIWAKSIGDSSVNNPFMRVNDVRVDPLGYLYVVGSFNGTVDFDPGAGISNLTAQYSPFVDTYILKLDLNGNFVWVKQIRGTYNVEPSSLKTDNMGNVYTTGYFSETIDLDPGVGVSNAFANGGADMFISKLDANGNFVWGKSTQGTGGYSETKPTGIAVDSLQNSYIYGYFTFTIDIDPSLNTFSFTSAGQRDIFVLKLDSNGDILWAKTIGTPLIDQPFDMAIDKLNNVYLTGFFQDTIDFDPNMGIAQSVSMGNTDAFVLKLSTQGDYVWAKTFGSPFPDSGRFIELDAAENLYIEGVFSDSVDFDPGLGVFSLDAATNGRSFILKLDTSAAFVWAISTGGGSFPKGMKVDLHQNIYRTGNFVFTEDFDPSAGVYALTPAINAGEDSYIQKISQCGLRDNSIKLYEGSLSSNVTNASFQWIDCNTNMPILGANSATFSPSVNGNYAVIITQGTCIDTSNCVFVNNVSLVENSLQSPIKAYPNPTTGSLKIDLGEIYPLAEISIYSALGKNLFCQKYTHSQKFELQMPDIQGIYFVSIKLSNKKTVMLKVSKM